MTNTQKPPIPDIVPIDIEIVTPPQKTPALPPEIGGAPGPEPTRYGDWSHKGRCTDF